MTRTPIRFSLFALVTAALTAVFASPAWAPSPICPTCSVKSTTWAITSSEMVRVCLVGLVTRPPRAAIDWEIGFFDAEGELRLTKQVQVPEQGFRCVDTTPEDLRFAGFEPEPSGRLQLGLRIASEEQVIVPGQETQKLSIGGLGYHSVETIDVVSNATKQAVKVFGYAGAKGNYTLEVVQ